MKTSRFLSIIMLVGLFCSCGSSDKSPAGYYTTSGEEGTANGKENFIVINDNLKWFGEITDYISVAHTGDVKMRYKYQGTINDNGELVLTKGDTRRTVPGVGIEGEIDGKGEVFAELRDGEIWSGGWQFKKHDISYKLLQENKSGQQVCHGDAIKGYLKIMQDGEVIFESKKENDVVYMVTGSQPGIEMILKKLHKGEEAEITHINPWTNVRLTYHIKIQDIASSDEILESFEQSVEESREKEPDIIAQYIADNNISVAPTASGLYIIVNKEGNGKTVQNGSTVTVDYVGRFFDGTMFDCSREDVAKKSGTYTEQRQYAPLTYTAGNSGLVAGWEEGVMGQPAGTELTLIMPSRLAYGETGAGTIIKPYTPLVFEINILSVE